MSAKGVLVLVVLACLARRGLGCWCTTTVVNVRDAPCGNQIGQGQTGHCFRDLGELVGCDLGGTWYNFQKIDFHGQDGWMANDWLVPGDPSQCGGDFEIPEFEFRSVFLTTVWNIDWPENSADPVSKQQQDMVNYVNTFASMGMNAIMFQVRGAGDAMYDSHIEPWSRYLTGNQGQPPNPYWDPLTFLVNEAHSRNPPIEVHAWLNPYRGHLTSNINELHPTHMCRRPPTDDYCYVYSTYLWMDPGAEEVIVHLEDVITDILDRYDVDGIHFDDYFYPYPAEGWTFPDDQTYQDSGTSMSKEDWRRDNVNRMINRINSLCNSHSTPRTFTVSPFGIYRPCHPDGMPCSIIGLDPYTELYADALHWLKQGDVDALCPQLYWAIGGSQDYNTLVEWWTDPTQNSALRHIYAANAVYKMVDSNNWPVSELENQALSSRARHRPGENYFSLGNIMYSAKYFRDNNKDITGIFQRGIYSDYSMIPPMPWKSASKEIPAAPTNIKVKGHRITWDEDSTNLVVRWAIMKEDGNKQSVYKLLHSKIPRVKVEEPGTYIIKGLDRYWVHGKEVVVIVE